jgi:hypothetical protein
VSRDKLSLSAAADSDRDPSDSGLGLAASESAQHGPQVIRVTVTESAMRPARSESTATGGRPVTVIRVSQGLSGPIRVSPA